MTMSNKPDIQIKEEIESLTQCDFLPEQRNDADYQNLLHEYGCPSSFSADTVPLSLSKGKRKTRSKGYKLRENRKVDKEGRVIQPKWKHLYFFVAKNSKPTCLICYQQIAVAKEYNVKRHYKSLHGAKFDHLDGQLREEKVLELERNLNSLPSFFELPPFNESGVKVSYIIAHKLALAMKPLTDGEFVRDCVFIAVDAICPDKKNDFYDIDLSKDTVVERVFDLAGDLHNHLKNKVQSLETFSVAIDIMDGMHLAIFIRGVDENMQVMEEFVDLAALKEDLTSEDVFNSMVEVLDKLCVDWTRLASLTTDGTPLKTGVATLLKEKLKTVNPHHRLYNIQSILHQETLCKETLKIQNILDVVVDVLEILKREDVVDSRFACLLERTENPSEKIWLKNVQWINRVTAIKHFFELRHEIKLFLDSKGRNVPELLNAEWHQELAFTVDILEHLNWLKMKTEGPNKIITDIYDNIRAFIVKLELWEKQLSRGNMAHFPALKSFQNGDLFQCHSDAQRYSEKIHNLRTEFQDRFSDLKQLEMDLNIFHNPFSVNVDTISEDLQMEMIELQCDITMKGKLSVDGSNTFYRNLGQNYPKLKSIASKVLCMFGTCSSEQLSSTINFIRVQNLPNILSFTELCSLLKLAATQSFVPNFDDLVQLKKLQYALNSNTRKYQRFDVTDRTEIWEPNIEIFS